MDNLSGCLTEVFELLKKTQPAAPIETDVVWKGPYYNGEPLWVEALTEGLSRKRPAHRRAR
jgi:hypothetical protein